MAISSIIQRRRCVELQRLSVRYSKPRQPLPDILVVQQVQEVSAGSSPLAGTFSLVYPGHAFQEAAQTGPISVHASASALASELSNLGSLTKDDIRVSRSNPSAEGEVAWTVTFTSGGGDVPEMQAVVDGVAGTGAALRVSTFSNGVAPVQGFVSLVASGVRGQVGNVFSGDLDTRSNPGASVVLVVEKHRKMTFPAKKNHREAVTKTF